MRQNPPAAPVAAAALPPRLKTHLAGRGNTVALKENRAQKLPNVPSETLEKQ